MYVMLNEPFFATPVQDTMDAMTSKIEGLRLDWAHDAAETDHHLVQLCSEFGGRYIAGVDKEAKILSLSTE